MFIIGVLKFQFHCYIPTLTHCDSSKSLNQLEEFDPFQSFTQSVIIIEFNERNVGMLVEFSIAVEHLIFFVTSSLYQSYDESDHHNMT